MVVASAASKGIYNCVVCRVHGIMYGTERSLIFLLSYDRKKNISRIHINIPVAATRIDMSSSSGNRTQQLIGGIW